MPKTNSICPLHGFDAMQYRLVTNGQTDGRTHDDSKYRASITSRDKMQRKYRGDGRCQTREKKKSLRWRLTQSWTRVNF